MGNTAAKSRLQRKKTLIMFEEDVIEREGSRKITEQVVRAMDSRLMKMEESFRQKYRSEKFLGGGGKLFLQWISRI